MDSLYVSNVLSLILLACQIISFLALRNVIKSKNQVIEDLKTLQEATDIKKLAEYYVAKDKIRGEFVIESAKREVQRAAEEFSVDIRRQYDELASFAYEFIQMMPQGDRDHIIDNNFPSCKNMFINRLKEEEANDKDH